MKVKNGSNGTYYVALDGVENIDHNHYHIAPDGTILAVKVNNKHVYNRGNERKRIIDVLGFEGWYPGWAPEGQRPLRYKATCGRCSIEYELPFRPDPGRPFICKSCVPLVKEQREKERAEREREREQRKREWEARQAERERRERERAEREREQEQRKREWEARQAERERRRIEGLLRLRETLDRKRDQWNKLIQAIKRKEEAITQKRWQVSQRPVGKSGNLLDIIEKMRREVMDMVQKSNKLHDEIREIEQKLR